MFQLGPVNRLHRLEQSSVASSEKEQHSMKKKVSVKLKENVKNAEPRDQH